MSDTTTAAAPPPFLTAPEIDEICSPLRQRHAQARKLCAMLGLDMNSLPRRPDGLPLVGRRMLEQRINGSKPVAIGGIQWSKP